MGRELVVRVRFESTRLAKENLRVAYELITPVRRSALRTPRLQAKEAEPASQPACRREKVS